MPGVGVGALTVACDGCALTILSSQAHWLSYSTRVFAVSGYSCAESQAYLQYSAIVIEDLTGVLMLSPECHSKVTR